MAIPQSTLRDDAANARARVSAELVNEAKRVGRQTAFLSHSHKDSELAKGVQGFLQAQGWDVTSTGRTPLCLTSLTEEPPKEYSNALPS